MNKPLSSTILEEISPTIQQLMSLGYFHPLSQNISDYNNFKCVKIHLEHDEYTKKNTTAHDTHYQLRYYNNKTGKQEKVRLAWRDWNRLLDMIKDNIQPNEPDYDIDLKQVTGKREFSLDKLEKLACALITHEKSKEDACSILIETLEEGVKLTREYREKLEE